MYIALAIYPTFLVLFFIVFSKITLQLVRLKNIIARKMIVLQLQTYLS